jgi:hypothetical protein
MLQNMKPYDATTLSIRLTKMSKPIHDPTAETFDWGKAKCQYMTRRHSTMTVNHPALSANHIAVKWHHLY